MAVFPNTWETVVSNDINVKILFRYRCNVLPLAVFQNTWENVTVGRYSKYMGNVTVGRFSKYGPPLSAVRR